MIRIAAASTLFIPGGTRKVIESCAAIFSPNAPIPVVAIRSPILMLCSATRLRPQFPRPRCPERTAAVA